MSLTEEWKVRMPQSNEQRKDARLAGSKCVEGMALQALRQHGTIFLLVLEADGMLVMLYGTGVGYIRRVPLV